MAGYDSSKAALFNNLRRQGVSEDDAMMQAGITDADAGNYAVGSNGQLGPLIVGSGTTGNSGSFPQTDYDEAPVKTVSTITKTTYTSTSTETVSGGGSTTLVSNQPLITAASREYANQGAAKQLEIDQFIKDNPSNFARKRQGLPPLSPEESAARAEKLRTLEDERSSLYNSEQDAKGYVPPTVYSEPNTTTTTTTTSTYKSTTQANLVFTDQDEKLGQENEEYLATTPTVANNNSARGTSVNPTSDPSQFPAYDDDGNLQPGFAVNDETGQTYYRGFETTREQPVNPASDPSQFPAYDDDGNLQPGFAVNDETGQTYYRGFGVTRDTPINPASDPSQFPAYDDDGNLQPGFAVNDETGQTYYRGFPSQDVETAALVDDPYYGLTPKQLQDLGGADPTDPYIRARLGIPQLPGSTLAATPGLGTIKTGVPLIDNALNFLGGLFNPAPTPPKKDQPVNPASDPSQFPAYDDEGNLMPGYAINEETGQTYYRGFETTRDQPVNPASDPSQFPAYDDEGNLQPGFAINEETGETYFQGVGPATGTGITTLSDEETAALFEGTDTPTAAQQAAINEQTASDAAALYPGTNNTNLRNINEAQAAIDQNEAGIANAEEIIARNNAELADPDISDARRAELEANNEAQRDYIQVATENTAINQNAIESNANAFAAGGGEPDSGQGPMEVAALEDPGLEVPVDEAVPPTEADLEVDPMTDDELAVYEAIQQDNRDILAEQATDVEPGDDPFEQARLEAAAQAAAEGPTESDLNVDPLTDDELAVYEAIQQDNRDALIESDSPTEVSPEEDPFEQARLDAEAQAAAEGPTEADLEVDPMTDDELAVYEAYQQDNRDILAEQATDVEPSEDPFEQARLDAEAQAAAEGPTEADLEVDPNEDEGLQTPPGAEDEQVEAEEPFALNPDEDPAVKELDDASRADAEARYNDEAGPTEDAFQGAQEAAVKERAKQQATFQARYKQTANQDWRVRLSLSPNAQYLYNAGTPRGSGAGILAPLAKTDGVIFPYTPSITTTYSANYEQYDLVHSNYRGVFYKNSRVGDINIRGTFTAQDTEEANYLLAVIHFFRSATKMFYGQDAERGTPPPVCLLNGLGQYQFSDHPVVISSFNYTTPNDVDYIRATNPNNYGVNLLNRRAAVASNPGGASLAGLNRLLNAAQNGLSKGALPNVPAPGSVNQSVNNTAGATYVPTKMEIDITLIPVQTRSQVSKQFSLKGFANGDLLKGGFW